MGVHPPGFSYPLPGRKGERSGDAPLIETLDKTLIGHVVVQGIGFGVSNATTLPVATLARTFIFSIVPIALAYHVSHYLS